MANEFKRELSININTNVNTKKIQDAEKIVNGFFNKYDGESIQLDINTKQAKVEVSEFTKMVQNAKELSEEISTVKTQSPSMVPSLRQDIAFLDSVKTELESTLAIFNDGTMMQGFDAITSKMSEGFGIVAVDLGERMQYIKAQISGALSELQAFGGVQQNWRGRLDFTSGHMDKSQLQERIELLKKLFSYQRELEAFQGKEFIDKNAPLGIQTDRESYLIRQLQREYDQLEEYNLKTTEQLKRRRQLIEAVQSSLTWDEYEQEEAKDNIHDDEQYEKAIQDISHYIQVRKNLIADLEANEAELFSADGITEYVNQANEEIDKLEGNMRELQDLREGKGGSSGDVAVTANLTEVLTALEKIEQAVKGVTEAFRPFTDALSMDGGAFSKLLSAGVEDLDTLEAKFKHLSDTIDAINKKEFSINQFMSNGSSDVISNSLRQYKTDARALGKQVAQLYKETQETYKIGSYRVNEQYFALLDNLTTGDIGSKGSALRADGISFNKIVKEINKTNSMDEVDSIVEQLNHFKKLLIEFNELRNKFKPGSFDGGDYKAIDKWDRSADDSSDTSNVTNVKQTDDNILTDIKSLSEKVDAEFTAIRAKIESTFDLSTIDPKLENIKNITDVIYQQFVELQDKIKALDLNLNTPVVAAADTKPNESVIDDAAKAMNNEGESAENAVPKKDAFTEANKKAAKSAQETEEATKGAAEGIETEAKAVDQSAGAIVEASDKFDKIRYVNTIDDNGIPHPFAKTTTSTVKRERAYETATVFSEYDDELGDYKAQTETIIKDFRKRAAELKKESDKIALAQKTVDKFISQFESKTAGQANTIKGFDALKNFKIGNLDDIEKATQQMLELDNEYNKITKSFREGTKSMNPFVNAITGINEMENKIKEVGIDFNNLNTKPAKLSSEVAALTPLLAQMKSFISTGADGKKTITDIYGLSEAYGKLNSALRQVNSNIKIQKKIDTSKSKNVNFGIDLDKQLQSLTKQQAQWKKNGQLTDEVRRKIDEMFDSLAKVTNSSELSAWKKQWSILQDAVVETRYAIEEAQQEQKQSEENYKKALSWQDRLYNAQKQLAKVDAGSAKGQELTRKINEWQKEYDIALDLLANEKDRAAVADRQLQLEKELNAVRLQSQNSYGKTIYNRENRYFDSILAQESNLGGNTALSSNFVAQLEKYKAAFRELEDLRQKFVNDPDAFNNDALQKEFVESAQKVEGLRKEILATFKDAQKFEELSAKGSILGVTEIDTNQFDDARIAMIEFANSITDGKFKFEGFNAAGTEMYGTLDKGAGVIEKVTVALRAGTNQMYAYQSGTKQVSNSWQQLGNSLKKSIAQMAAMYLSFQDIVRYIKQGVTYVKEIDLALTELKKVTDETDATYKEFLKTASSTSAVIGSTISDFTDATAAFARLGYSIEESSKMAETAIVYKNVADGLDTVEESTESIISTMMAFGIEAEDTISIIDRFNAVGNNFAITSAGIGEALQRSASALYAGGNTIDESIALVTAANSVIQNPEQVGTALKTLTLRLRGAKVELEEAGLDAENMVESTSTLQAKLKALTHGEVDIMLDADTFKNTTQILREMSEAWEDMTDIERAKRCPYVQKCA